MLEVANIQVKSFDLDYLQVSWEIGASVDALDYTFEVLRSEGPAGPFRPITGKFENIFSFRDIEANQLSKHRDWYYKIRVTKKSDSTAQEYPTTAGGVRQSALPDLEALEISRRMRLVLREFMGRKVWIFPIRTFGQRCSACYDENTDRRTRSQCLTCFDVGYTGGFHSPIETYVQIDPSGRATNMTPLADGQVTNATGRLSNFPLLKPRDIVVEAENKRWRVSNVRTTEKLRSVVHQEVVLHLIPKTDIEYRLPIGANLDTFKPSPPKQYLNSHKV